MGVGVVLLEEGGGANHPRLSLSLWMAKADLILPSLVLSVNLGVNLGFGELKKEEEKEEMFFLR